jgi:siroheme synthase-like protein
VTPAETGGVPLVARLAGQRVVCVGGGPVAAAKALPLLDAGADLLVVAPTAVEGIRAAAVAGRLRWERRVYAAGDLDRALLALAATADPGVNARVAAEAARRPCLCVRVDSGAAATASFAAAVRRGPLTIAVSTDGRAPVLSRWLRQRLEAEYGPEWGELAALLGELRASPEVEAAMAGLDAAGRARRWRAALDALLAGGAPSPDRAAALARLGAAPGPPISSSRD